MNFRIKSLARAVSGRDPAATACRPSASPAVLVLVGVIGASLSGQADALLSVPIPADTCGPQAGFQTSQVLDAVTGTGPYHYGFRVCNTSTSTSVNGGEGFPAIRDWELPFFGTDLNTDNEANITGIDVPDGWFVQLEQIGVPNPMTGWDGQALWQQVGDPFRVFFDAFFGGAGNNPYNFHTHVLHFYTPFFEGEFFCSPSDDVICAGDSLAGFGFIADFDPTNAPYQASWVDEPPQTGDPAFPLGGQPNSPTIQNALNNIPEPGSLALLAGGGMLVGAAVRRRKQKSQDQD